MTFQHITFYTLFAMWLIFCYCMGKWEYMMKEWKIERARSNRMTIIPPPPMLEEKSEFAEWDAQFQASQRKGDV